MSIPSDGNVHIEIEYVLDGPANAAAVARGQSHLTGIVIGDGTAIHQASTNIGGHILQYGDRPRLYHDAILARVIENRYRLPAAAVFDDTRILFRLLDESHEFHQRQTDERNPDEQRLSEAVNRVRLAPHLARELFMHIQAEDLIGVYRNIELPVVPAVAAMIGNGIRIDLENLNAILPIYEARVTEARLQINQHSGRSLNPNSHEALVSYLYGDLHLPIVRYTNNGNPSTSAEAIEPLRNYHPVVAPLIQYRNDKPVLDSLNGLRQHSSHSIGKLYPNLDPLGIVTGRINCEAPNLLALSQAARSPLIAAEGYTLIEADISQTELRILAQATQDPNLIAEFQMEGVDIHRRVASHIWSIREADVTPQQRRVAKAINFGILYGQSPNALALELDINVSMATTFIESYFSHYSRVRPWIHSVKQHAQDDGYVVTMSGRRRHFPEVRYPGTDLHRVDRQAVNAVIQGTAADLLKIILAELFRRLPSDCQLLLSVHDSVLIQAPDAAVPEVVGLIRSVMESPIYSWSVPLRVEVKIGRSWGNMQSAFRVPINQT